MVDRPLDEAELVERARRGDLEAWETLVRTYQGIAFRTAYVLAGNAADAEEAAQDASGGGGETGSGSQVKPALDARLIRSVAGPRAEVVRVLEAAGITARADSAGVVVAEGTPAAVREALAGRSGGDVAVYVK